MSKKCTPLWREAHFEVKMHKTHQVRTTFGSCDVEKIYAVVARSQIKIYKVHHFRITFRSSDVEKMHAIVARSTFPSQNVQNTSVSDYFWKFRCRKSARRCGAKHISKSKCTKCIRFGPLLEVAMSKKCTPLWCEAHFQIKMYKRRHSWTPFGNYDVEKVHAVVARSQIKIYKTHHSRITFRSSNVEKVHAIVARSTFPSQNVQNISRSDYFWKFRCRKSARRCGAKHISKTNIQNTSCSRHF